MISAIGREPFSPEQADQGRGEGTEEELQAAEERGDGARGAAAEGLPDAHRRREDHADATEGHEQRHPGAEEGLADEQPVIARSLAERMGLSRAGVSKTLGKLERRGFIARTPNPADRRAALVTITPDGAKAVDELFPRQLAAEVELLAGLGEDREWVLKALGRLVEVMEGGAGRG